jgi:hypothetical protein
MNLHIDVRHANDRFRSFRVRAMCGSARGGGAQIAATWRSSRAPIACAQALISITTPQENRYAPDAAA